ncbi:putative reverse transcriptase domain-containing protein [Tanacetum coccineum]
MISTTSTKRGQVVNQRVLTCFEYGRQGHYRSDYPKLKYSNRGNKTGNKSGISEARGKAYVLGGGDADPDSNTITGTFLLNNHYVYVLFDSGADRSFVSNTFSALLVVILSTLDVSYAVELADKRIVETNTILRGCMLGLLGHPFNIDLMPVDLGSFDIIIGMDLLANNHAVIVCDEKIVRIPYEDKVLIFQGDRSDKRKKLTLSIILCTKTQKYINKGFLIFLAQVMVKKTTEKSKEKRLKDVPTVQDFPKDFLEDLPGLPSTRQVDIKEDENEPDFTCPYEEMDSLNPPSPASESEPDNEIEDGDRLLPGFMRRDIDSLFGRMVNFSRRLCGRETAYALVEKKSEAKDKFYGKLILDLGNEVRSSVDQGTAAMERLVEKLGNVKEKAECKKLKKELEEAKLSNTFLRMQNERVERDLYWTRVRAHEFYQEMIRKGFVFEERPNEAIDVPIEDVKSSSPKESFNILEYIDPTSGIRACEETLIKKNFEHPDILQTTKRCLKLKPPLPHLSLPLRIPIIRRVSQPSAPKTSIVVNARRNNEKALNILLSAIPDRHLLSFHDAQDAQSLWAAIKARFGGNKESKKMQKNLLKQQFETFVVGAREEIGLSLTDSRPLLLLPPVWHVVATMIRGQPGLDELDFDDLYNNLKVYEHELKGASSSNSQSIAFMSTEIKGSTSRQSTVDD